MSCIDCPQCGSYVKVSFDFCPVCFEGLHDFAEIRAATERRAVRLRHIGIWVLFGAIAIELFRFLERSGHHRAHAGVLTVCGCALCFWLARKLTAPATEKLPPRWHHQSPAR